MPLPVRIVSVGSHTPKRLVTSAELDAAHGRAPGTTLARSGVGRRHWVGPDESSLSMVTAAARQALERAGLDADDLDAVIVASIMPQQPMPTTAILLARELGATGGSLQAYDVNASCLGFLTALQQASFGIVSGAWRRVLVAAVDLASKGLNHDDLESSALFGDGAATAVLAASDSGSQISSLRLTSYPAAANLCRIPAGGTRWNSITPPPSFTDYLFAMDGLGMMKLVAREMPGFLDGLLAEAGVCRDEVDVVVPHQASGLGLRFLRERLGIRPTTVVDILADRGNQVSASMPTALAAAVDQGRLQRGDICLLIGTGAGLVFGGAVLEVLMAALDSGVEVIVAGHCKQLERLVRRGGPWRPIEFPSAAAILPHPGGGVALFDTGYAPRFHTATARLPYRLYSALLPTTCTAADAAVTQLATRGIGADEVKLVVLSHVHGDHVAGLRDFPAARVVIGDGALASGWRTGSAWRNTAHGFVPALLPDDLEARLLPLAELTVRPTGLAGRLRNGHDLFGDGTALVIPLPGHTEGHLGLWLPSSGVDGVLLVGDAVWHQRAITHGELPLPFLRGSRPLYEQVVAELARLHNQRPDLLIVPSHCSASLSRVIRG